ncbi:hypothetical protein [Gordonia sp. SL306]|uniref:hypothetical protein n=1 Tax=Gordonia sp. SL306 TaxID=2995145 RepID=UPI0022714013|nr:hypothetical protein [Gordonia sp. SL306]WAC54969.1 hypothetical protein OVA31_20380 [Gordonia sp. SL306]
MAEAFHWPGSSPGVGEDKLAVIREKMINAMIVAPLARLIAPKLGLDPTDFDTIEEIEAALNPWGDLFGGDVDFGELVNVFEGDYTGDDAALLAIQSAVGTLRSLAGGLIDPSRIPQLFLSQLSNASSPNLLSGFGDFGSAATIVDGGTVWTWDASQGRTAPGSTRTTADGTLHVLNSEAVAASEGQALAVEAYAKWSGIASTGTAFLLQVRAFNGPTLVSTTTIGDPISSPAASGGWSQLHGTFTVPAGVDSVKVQLAVAAAVTAGTVWFDDVSLRKTATSLPQDWITDLPDSLGDLWTGLTNLVNQALTALGITPTGSILDKILDLADELGDWLDSTEDQAANLDDLIGNLLANPSTVIGALPQSLVSGLSTALSNAHAQTLAVINAVLEGIRKVPMVGGDIADRLQELVDEVTSLNNTAVGTHAAIISGHSGGSDGDTAVREVIANYQNRLSALEGGGTLFTCATSTTLDLSAFGKFKVWMWESSSQGQSAGGAFMFRAFTAAQLEALGVDLSAVSVVVGAGAISTGPTDLPARKTSRFGNYGSSWALSTGTGNFIIDSDGLYRQATNQTSGGNRGSGQAQGRQKYLTGSGNTDATSGASGGGSHIASGGNGGPANQTGDGGNGGAGETADYTNGAYAGGGAGGNGGGGGVDGTAPKNGGNGGPGGWPGGAPGLYATGGSYNNNVSTTNGSPGAMGAPANGGVLIEAS